MVNITLTNKNNFYSQRLTGGFLRLYDASVENLARGVLSTSVDLGYLASDDVEADCNKVVDAIIYGCPELFYVEQNVKYTLAGSRVTLDFKSKYANEDVAVLWGKLDAEINRIAKIVKAIPKPYDQLHRINSYLCARVGVNTSAEGRYGDAYGALILKEARCEGFAKAGKLILDRVGFDSIIACGDALTPQGREKHAWNIVAFNGNHYHFDFTWNSGRGQYGIPGQEYMFLDDDQANVEHFPQYEYPCCTDDSKTFWAKNRGIVRYYSELSKINIVPFKNNYMAIAKFIYPYNEEIKGGKLGNEVFEWMRDELSAHSYASQLSYAVNESLDLLIFYFINQ